MKTKLISELLLLSLTFFMTACAGNASTIGIKETVGVIAIGHSGLTGEGSDPSHPHEDARENSWATGTTTGLNSVYQRLAAVHPQTIGHVANTAEGGARATSLADQALAALQTVPYPELVLIQTIDNDIRCDGSDADNLSAFGDSVAKALHVIVEASPNSHILLLSQPGRPAEMAAVEASDPVAKTSFVGSGMCDFFDPDGKINQEHIANLTTIIESYEAKQAQVCATVPQCSTDGGAFATYIDDISRLVPDDWNHITVEGQTRLAEIIWPIVSKVLHLE